MGLPQSAVYGGGGPLGSPAPSPLQEDGDYTNEKSVSVVHIAVAAILLLVAIRVLYEIAS